MEKASACRCGRCHRVLKDAKSIDRGYGIVCWKKSQAEEAEWKRRQTELDLGTN